MLIYILVAILFLFNSFLEEKKFVIRITKSKRYTSKTVLGFFDAIILITLSSLRSMNVGTDVINYARWFRRYEALSVKDAFFNNFWEFGYYILNKLAIEIGLDFHGFMALHSIVCVCILWYVLNYLSDNVSLGFYFFFTIGHLPSLFSLFRLELAILVVALTVVLLMKEENKKAIFFAILACVIHTSAIIGVIIYPILKIKDRKQFTVYLCALLLIISIMLLGGLQYIFIWYSTFRGTEAYQQSFHGGINLFLLLLLNNILCYFLIKNFHLLDRSNMDFPNIPNINICKSKQITSQRDINKKGLNMKFLEMIKQDNKIFTSWKFVLIGNLIQILALYNGTMTRVVLFFTLYYTTLIPSIVMKKKSLRLYKYMFIVEWFIIFVLSLLNPRNVQHLVPYEVYQNS